MCDDIRVRVLLSPRRGSCPV